MAGEFAGRRAVVTGAAQGLGRAAATLLAERGARVALVDANAAACESAVAELAARGLDARAIRADVTDQGEVDAMRDAVLGAFGGLDVLVNNVGAYPHRTIREISVEDWDHVFDVNLKSTFLVTRAFMDAMAEAGYGRVVNVASNDAYVAKPSLAHYAAAKAGVVSLTRTFAAELAPRGVLVNGVSPGAIATERAKSQSWLAERIRQIPVGRAGEPEDLAEVILFLASDRNRFMAGETVIANGGYLMV